MGDRAVIVFTDANGQEAAVYVHYDGSEAKRVLAEFFTYEQDNPAHDDRFDDASYLAARFIVWRSKQSGNGIGVTVPSHRENRNWHVHCDKKGALPKIESLT